MMVLMFWVFSPLFEQNNQVLGIGSGSTIVHAVQRIGMVLGCVLDILCGVVGGEVEGWGGSGP